MSRADVWVEMRVALLGVAEAARRAAHALSALGRMITPEMRLHARRSRFGGMASDLERWPDRWMTFQCAGLLCWTDPAACPSNRDNLHCTCFCHDE